MSDTPSPDQEKEMETVTSPDGTEIAYERTGNGPLLVCVHGSWSSHHDWDGVVPGLSESFSVVTYDRRGHSQSERPSEQGSVTEDVADLAALIERLGGERAWVAGNSFGASITLRLATTHPERVHGVVVHEPPLFGVIADDPDLALLVEEDERMTASVSDRIASGDHAGGAERFIEHELGSGSWSTLPSDFRSTLIENAPTFLDEARDPERTVFDPSWLADFHRPVMLTTGSESPPTYAEIVSRLADALPAGEVAQIEGAGHLPHVTQPDEYVEATRDFIRNHTD